MHFENMDETLFKNSCDEYNALDVKHRRDDSKYVWLVH
jgi:hypothetical protein